MSKWIRPIQEIDEVDDIIDIRIEDNLRVIEETKDKIIDGSIEFDMLFMSEIFDQYEALAKAFAYLENAFLDHAGTERPDGHWLSLSEREVAIVDFKTRIDN